MAAKGELSERMKHDLASIAGCIAGAEQVDRIREMLEEVGFQNINITEKENSGAIINSWVPGKGLGELVGSFIIEAKKN